MSDRWPRLLRQTHYLHKSLSHLWGRKIYYDFTKTDNEHTLEVLFRNITITFYFHSPWGLSNEVISQMEDYSTSQKGRVTKLSDIKLWFCYKMINQMANDIKWNYFNEIVLRPCGTYRLFFLRSIAQFFTQIYMNCFISS